MQLDLKLIFHGEDGSVLCFVHAVKAVMEGAVVRSEIDEFGQSGYDMRRYHCDVCNE